MPTSYGTKKPLYNKQSTVTTMTNNKRRSNNHQSSSHHFGGALSSAALIIIASHALTTSPSTTCSSIIRPAAAFSGTASPSSSSFIVHSSHHPPQRQSIIQLFSTVDDGSRQQYGQYGTDEEIIIPSSSSSPQKRRRRRIMRSGKTKSSLAVVTSVKSTAAAVSSGDDQSSNINIGDASQGTLSAANNSTTTTTPSSKKQSSTSQSSISSKIVSGAPYQRAEMMEHTILTKDEEFIYGRQVVRARELRERIEEFLEEKRLHHDDDEMCMMEEEESRLREEEDEFLLMMGSRDDDDENLEDYLNDREGGKTKRKTNKSNKKNNSELNEDFLSYELEYLSVYGFRPSIQDFENNDLEGGEGAVVAAAGKNIMSSSSSSSSGGGGGGSSGGAGTTTTLGGFDLEDDLLIDHAQHRSHHMSQLRNNPSPLPSSSSSSSSSSSTKRTGYRNSSSSSTAASNSYTPLLHIPLHELSDHDVISTLDISGGRTELVNILLEGAYAREVLMRRNVKLVTSIAKQWMRNSFSTANANLGSSSTSSTTNNSGRSTRKYLSQMYEGSWDRPSLDEAVQEGMLGLARAVDKYDPERGLRFSTYATHWITSYVRVCFQRAVTGCLRVPSQLHDIKAAYQKIVKDHLVSGEEPPEQTAIAKTLGITPQRLSTAIRATGSLVSVDAPVISPGSGSYKGSAAGGDGGNSQELLILDTLKCAEPKPEDQVEISFLRQCLENAMASELTPCERDVLRLRLGLDSGTGKTVREIVEICGGGVTMSDVRSAERRAFKKLRSPTSVHTHNLLAYLDLAGADITFR